MIYCPDVSRYKGKTVERIELPANLMNGEHIDMQDWVVIVFTDGERINLSTDWRGQDCYISQYQDKNVPKTNTV